MRDRKIFEPDERRWIEDNLYCPYCGSTNQWQFDVRLRHVIENDNGHLIIAIDPKRSDKIKHAIGSDIRRNLDEGRFLCANCQNEHIDYHVLYVESCLSNDCPGCFHCGNWIDKDELIELCEACINKHNGNISEDDCNVLCEHYDNGLGEVREHYGITLDDLKQQLGYL